MFGFWNLILSNLPWFWLSVMILCLVFEAVTFSLTTIWAVLAAFPMIFISRAPVPFRWQFLIFFLVTILLLVFTRPFAVKKLKLGRVSTNVNSLEGQEILVIKKITKFEKGEVRSSNGVVWAAMCHGEEIPKGSVCEIVGVEGNTLIVKEK